MSMKKTFLQQYEAMFPVEYDLASYNVTNSPIANTEKSGYKLRPLTWETTTHLTPRLGPQMTDCLAQREWDCPASLLHAPGDQGNVCEGSGGHEHTVV